MTDVTTTISVPSTCVETRLATGATNEITRSQRVFQATRQNNVRNAVSLDKGFPWRAPSAFLHGRKTVSESPGNMRFTSRSYQGNYPWESLEWYSNDHFPGLRGTSPKWDSNRVNQVQVECMLKFQEGKINLGTSLGESRETLNFIAQNMSRVLRAYRAVRKGNFGKAASNLGIKFRKSKGTPFDHWMEYQYGWLPMLGDINDAYGTLQKGFRSKEQLLNAVRVVTDSANPPSDRWVKGDSIRKHRCKIYARVKQAELFAATQLGLTNPLAIAWELVPLSFVIDWMVPVGNVLSALTATMGLEFVSGTTSCSVRGSYTKTGSYTGPQWPSGTPTGSRATATTTVDTYERTVLGGFPIPRPYYKSPFSSSHITTALALLRQRT